MRQPPPPTKTPEELDAFEQVLKRLLGLPPQQPHPPQSLNRRADRLAHNKKTRRQVSSSA